MPSFGESSRTRLATAHPKLILVFEEVIKRADCSILCGHRTKEEQEDAFKRRVSKARWGESPHNYTPALAVDVVPYPIDWDDHLRMAHFAGRVCEVAHSLGIAIEWGGDWDGDTSTTDQSFLDLPHFQLANWRPYI